MTTIAEIIKLLETLPQDREIYYERDNEWGCGKLEFYWYEKDGATATLEDWLEEKLEDKNRD